MENPRSNSWNPLPSPAFYMPMMPIQSGLAEPSPLGRFLGLPSEVTVGVGAEAELGGARERPAGWAHRSLYAVLSLLPAPPEGLSSLCLLKAPAYTTGRQVTQVPQKNLSRRNQDTPLKPAKLPPESSPPASPVQHENKQLFPRIVWVDRESQNLRTEII